MDPYRVLEVLPTATDEEIRAKYHDLVRRYHPDNFANNPTAAEMAEEKMKEINEAYETITRERAARRAGGAGNTGGAGGASNGSSSNGYTEIRRKIQSGLFAEAEKMLDAYPQNARGAEWHYLKSVVLARRGWMSDAIREIETACMMDPNNAEYQNARDFYRNRAGSFGGGYQQPRRAYQGRGSECTACDMCTNLICLDCCCECVGFDLIRCI